jgi:hypothetical protein
VLPGRTSDGSKAAGNILDPSTWNQLLQSCGDHYLDELLRHVALRYELERRRLAKGRGRIRSAIDYDALADAILDEQNRRRETPAKLDEPADGSLLPAVG